MRGWGRLGRGFGSNVLEEGAGKGREINPSFEYYHNSSESKTHIVSFALGGLFVVAAAAVLKGCPGITRSPTVDHIFATILSVSLVIRYLDFLPVAGVAASIRPGVCVGVVGRTSAGVTTGIVRSTGEDVFARGTETSRGGESGEMGALDRTTVSSASSSKVVSLSSKMESLDPDTYDMSAPGGRSKAGIDRGDGCVALASLGRVDSRDVSIGRFVGPSDGGASFDNGKFTRFG